MPATLPTVNQLKRRPWLVVTATANSTTPLINSQFGHTAMVLGFNYFGYTSGVADEVQVFDGDLNVCVCNLLGVAGKTPVSWFFSDSIPVPIRNLSVPLITSGCLEIILA